jgi:hypothetical protein
MNRLESVELRRDRDSGLFREPGEITSLEKASENVKCAFGISLLSSRSIIVLTSASMPLPGVNSANRIPGFTIRIIYA